MEEQKHTPAPRKGNCPTCGILCIIDNDNAAGNDNYYPVTNGLLQQVAELTKENTDLLAKVSEQEKEIERLRSLCTMLLWHIPNRPDLDAIRDKIKAEIKS